MKTRAVFKMEGRPGRETPLAVFPDSGKGCSPGMVMTYAHAGQHSEASPEYVASLRDASADEAAGLVRELEETVGYDLEILPPGERGGLAFPG